MFWKNIKEKFEKYPFAAIYITQAEQNDLWGKFNLLAGFSNQAIHCVFEPVKSSQWLMGGFCYEYQIPFSPYPLPSIALPTQFWFEAEEIIEFPSSEKLPELPICSLNNLNLTFHTHLTSKKYIDAVEKIKNYIQLGDHYEMNLTREFTAKGEISVFETFIKLIQKSPTPFSVVYKWRDKYILCASPERFLQKNESKLLSQPIKGTTARNNNDWEDEKVKQDFQNNVKFRSENVMIVDLVRNDLSRVCQAGSVIVDKLFEVQSFKYLHHLVSSVSGELKNGMTNQEIFAALFPPGSMTGAPKLRAMQRIAELEPAGRGIYSGCLGYFHHGNFDFNVVIRSIVYDEKEKTLSFHTGGAITSMSDPLEELYESELKAQAIMELFV